MARNQEDISLVLDKSLSVIDTSRVSIDRNRQTINEVTDDMTSLDCKLENITTALQLDLVELSQFTSLYVRVDLVIEELKRFSLKGLFLLEHFKVQLGFLSLSRLSTEIIDPFQLKIALNNIAMHLPPNLKLPCVPDKSLWTYNQSLGVSTFLHEDHMIVVIVLPLIQYDHQFEVYGVINLGVPYVNNTVIP